LNSSRRVETKLSKLYQLFNATFEKPFFMWVENAFKEFHKHCGYCTNLDIDDLSKQKDLVPFVDVLVIFMF
jgi:hypothetical protein